MPPAPPPNKTPTDRRAEWPLDPDIAYLNHGGYGVTPIPVLAAQEEWRQRIERNPTGFMARELPAALRQTAAEVAKAVGAAASDLVFVENATAGINAVLRSLRLGAGDEILVTSLAYPAVLKAARFVCEAAGASLVEVEIPLPVAAEETVTDAVASRLSRRTRLVIFDHIASASALVLPVAKLTALARQVGARVLIDGAHAPGQIPLDIAAIGAEYYVGNLHKWYFAPRGCGFLHAAPAAQEGLHPLAISHGLGGGIIAEFDWTGTRDFSHVLAAPAGIGFHASLGGAALMARNRGLARAAATLLAREWRSEMGGPSDAFAAMATVRLPLADEVSTARAVALCRFLAERHRIEVAINAVSGALWLRISAQAYNDLAEYERLAAIFAAPRNDLP
ncbi:MAG TPA: aminotransferase class V-fold PLP-dependent enzyme [Stellaceae bacterium]|nr:aminotransferase class V-fold PLP-dependent enzyme [Stellaceae bacterium]